MIGEAEVTGLATGGELEEAASSLHSVIGLRLAHYLAIFVDENQLGYVCGPDTDFNIPGVGLRRLDISFVTLAKMPEPLDEEVPFAPDLAAEVISRTDDWSAVVAKANLYLRAGARLVWVIDPYTRRVLVFREGRKHGMLTEDEQLKGEDVIPNFQMTVGTLFSRPPARAAS